MVSSKFLLSDLTREAIDLFDEASLFLDPGSGERITFLQDELDEAQDPVLTDEWESDRGMPLAKVRKIIDEWLLVPKPESHGDGRRIERFIGRTPKSVREKLREAFTGRGRFRRFRTELHELGIRNAWEEYRARDHAATLVHWGEAHGVPIVRDMQFDSAESEAEGASDDELIELPLQPGDVVRGFCQAVTDADFDGILRFAGAKIVLVDSIGKRVDGARSVVQRWKDLVADAPGYAISVDRVVEKEGVVCVFGSVSGTVIGRGTDASVLRFRGPAAWEVRVDGQHILEWREYVDHSVVRFGQRGASE